ncbi:MAG TPA: class I SAM-dependent methyltransferase [Syntrophomonadaceae bacterium]|nr:class I SAM-dependent methyltransferase [Syntrophomonadaceae bacterium]HQE23380.1 class I SAM-dependent methyltransferase [Syntrophomonadaceae bacterium]
MHIIAGLLVPGQPAADIGADHALLAMYLVDKQIAPRVIATELGDGPYQRLCKAVNDSPYANRIEVRQGDGLQPLMAGEVTNIIVAGMGGETIAKILSHDWVKSGSFSRFVLQPMSRPGVLRRILAHQGWEIREERLVWQNRRLFIIIEVIPGNHPYHLTPLEIEAGPILLRQADPLAQVYRQQLQKKYKHLRDSLLQSKTRPNRELLTEVEDKLRELEVFLK